MGRTRTFDDARAVEAARDQFWAKGYSATSLDDLASAMGLGRGSIYSAYGSKHGLFMRVIDEYATAKVEGIRDILVAEGSAVERLMRLFMDVSRPDWPVPFQRGCLLATSCAELACRDEELTARAARTYDEVERLLDAVLHDAGREGSLPAKTDVTALGRVLLSILQGMDLLAKAGDDPEHQRANGRYAVERLLAV